MSDIGGDLLKPLQAEMIAVAPGKTKEIKVEVPSDVKIEEGILSEFDGGNATISAVSEIIKGRVYGVVEPDHGVLKIHSSKIGDGNNDVGNRGKGYGTGLYKSLIDEAFRRGMDVASDSEVTLPAAHVYEKLKNLGYRVTTNPNARLIKVGGEDKWSTREGETVFTIRRPEITDQKESEKLISIGTSYLWTLHELFGLNDTTVNFMVNYKCHGKCDHCFARDLITYQRELNREMSPDEVYNRESLKRQHMMRVMDDFRGTKRAFFTGGEPFFEGSGEKEIFPLINHAATCFQELYIDTNAMRIPLDISKARDFLQGPPPIPRNVVLCLSIDQYHAKVDPHLTERIAICEQLAKEGLIKTAYNIRIPGRKNRQQEIQNVLYTFHLLGKYNTELERNNLNNTFFIHRIQAMGAAADLGYEEADKFTLLDPRDVLDHTYVPQSTTIFVTPEGDFATSVEAAFMTPPRPQITVVGNFFRDGTKRVLENLINIYTHNMGVEEKVDGEITDLISQIAEQRYQATNHWPINDPRRHNLDDMYSRARSMIITREHAQAMDKSEGEKQLDEKIRASVELMFSEQKINWRLPVFPLTVADYFKYFTDERKKIFIPNLVDFIRVGLPGGKFEFYEFDETNLTIDVISGIPSLHLQSDNALNPNDSVYETFPDLENMVEDFDNLCSVLGEEVISQLADYLSVQRSPDRELRRSKDIVIALLTRKK